MLDPEKLRTSYEDLAGLLIIISENKKSGTFFYSVTSGEKDKIKDVFRGVEPNIEERIDEALNYLESQQKSKMGNTENTRWILNFETIVQFEYKVMSNDIDYYFGKGHKNLTQFGSYASVIGDEYFKMYENQIKSVPKYKKIPFDIFEIAPDWRFKYLIMLSENLISAVKANNPNAQLAAEDNFYRFAPSEIFKPQLDEISSITHKNLRRMPIDVLTQVAIIDSISREDYKLVASLNDSYSKQKPL
jgi:hypothetical protein